MSAVGTPPASPLDAVLQWPDAAVVSRAPEAVALAERLGVVHLPAVRGVRTAVEALRAALAREARAEAADQSAEVEAVATQRTLLAAFRPRLEDAASAKFRASLQPLLAAWADPYAADASGLAQLARVRSRLSEAPLEGAVELAQLCRALDAMEAAGTARDRAHHERLAAIKARVTARSRLDAVLGGFLATLEPQVVSAWLAGLDPWPEPDAPDAPEEAWFLSDD